MNYSSPEKISGSPVSIYTIINHENDMNLTQLNERSFQVSVEPINPSWGSRMESK
jgi:hypothetical protein